MSKQLFTIGYEGLDSERLVGVLRSAGVAVLADVRAVANSRKRGFSKTALRLGLEAAVRAAKAYVAAAIAAADDLAIGEGHGPVHHFFAIWA